MGGQKRPILRLKTGPRASAVPCSVQRLFRAKTPQDADFSLFCRLLFGICFSMPFWLDFLSIFDPNLAPTWPPKSTKINEKSMPRCLPKMTSFFDRFLIDFCSQFGPPEPQKSLKFYCFFNVFLIFGVLNIRSILGSIWVPTWLHFGSPNPRKSAPKSRYGGAKLGSRGAQIEVWRAPERGQDVFWAVLSVRTNF